MQAQSRPDWRLGYFIWKYTSPPSNKHRLRRSPLKQGTVPERLVTNVVVRYLAEEGGWPTSAARL